MLAEGFYTSPTCSCLTHWGRVTHICISKLTIIGSDNGLLPRRHQAIIWTNAEILLIRPLGTKFNEIFIKNHTFSFKKMHLKMLSAKWRPYCLGLECVKNGSYYGTYMYNSTHLVVLRLEYSKIIWSITWLLMPWIHASPGHKATMVLTFWQ